MKNGNGRNLFQTYKIENEIPKKKVKLEGLLKGIKINKKDVEEAKKAIFKF